MKFSTKQSLRHRADQADACSVSTLEKALGNRNPEVRATAVAALRARGEAGFYALLRAAAHGNPWQRQEAVICLGYMRDVRALQPLLASLTHDRRLYTSRSVGRFCLATLVTCFNGQDAAPLWAETFCADADLQICAAEALGNLGDPRALLPLIRLGRQSHIGVCMAVRNALYQLLPRVAELTPEQARALGPNAVPEIASLLYDYDEPLVRLAIAALYAVGDIQAIPVVSRLATASDRPYSYPYLHPYVCQEAQRLLVVLIERVVQERLRTTLLRGSRVPTRLADTRLLRPAATAHERDGDFAQLLHPAGASAQK